MMQRRIFLSATSTAALGLWTSPLTQAQTQANEATAFARLVAQGACAVLIRHAQTESGIGDPPGYRLDNCSSQRQLSAAGRAQSERRAKQPVVPLQRHGLSGLWPGHRMDGAELHL